MPRRRTRGSAATGTTPRTTEGTKGEERRELGGGSGEPKSIVTAFSTHRCLRRKNHDYSRIRDPIIARHAGAAAPPTLNYDARLPRKRKKHLARGLFVLPSPRVVFSHRGALSAPSLGGSLVSITPA